MGAIWDRIALAALLQAVTSAGGLTIWQSGRLIGDRSLRCVQCRSFQKLRFQPVHAGSTIAAPNLFFGRVVCFISSR